MLQLNKQRKKIVSIHHFAMGKKCDADIMLHYLNESERYEKKKVSIHIISIIIISLILLIFWVKIANSLNALSTTELNVIVDDVKVINILFSTIFIILIMLELYCFFRLNRMISAYIKSLCRIDE